MKFSAIIHPVRMYPFRRCRRNLSIFDKFLPLLSSNILSILFILLARIDSFFALSIIDIFRCSILFRAGHRGIFPCWLISFVSVGKIQVNNFPFLSVHTLILPPFVVFWAIIKRTYQVLGFFVIGDTLVITYIYTYYFFSIYEG